jgi:membrane-bound lytic murein transglycosylase D
MTLQRFVRIACVAALVAVSGCATPPASTSDGRTVPASPVGVPAETTTTRVDAPLAPALPSNPAAARLVLQGAPNSVALGSIVVTNPIAPRTLDLTQRADDIWDRIRTGFAIPNIDTPLVAEQQAWFLSHPDYLRRAVDRSSLYLFHIVEELNKRGMPTELALLPFVESAYNPMAYSRAHASGMWQFIPGTGRDYNLKQDWWRDDRRDVIASTDAALTYLQTIYEMHGDWHLALASYNWGEGSVKRAIERNQAAGLPTDYLSLSMPDETRNYVPKLQALKNIIANPGAFGVTLPRIDNEPYFAVVPRERDMDVRTAARLANMTLEDFRALNPSFNRPIIRASSDTPLLVPADRAADFTNGMRAQSATLATWQAHTVQRKETVEKIAARYGMTSAALREVNGLAPRAQVRPGQGLLVQKRGEGDVGLRFASFNPPTSLITLQGSTGESTVQVKRGETLASIAKRQGMTVEALRALNHLKGRQAAVGTSLRVQAPRPHLVKVQATRGGAVATRARQGPPTHRVATHATTVIGAAASHRPSKQRR